MAVNFPNSPSTNDTHTENGYTWKWDGTTWIIQSIAPPGPTGPTGSGSSDPIGSIVAWSGSTSNICLLYTSPSPRD